MSRWICDAAALAKLHYNTDWNLSCVAPKGSGFVLLSSDYGVGAFLRMIESSSKPFVPVGHHEPVGVLSNANMSGSARM